MEVISSGCVSVYLNLLLEGLQTATSGALDWLNLFWSERMKMFFFYVESFDGKVPRLDLSGVHNKGLDDLVDCWHWLHLSWAFLTFCWCMMFELTDSPFDVHDRKSQRFRQSDEARMDKGTWKAFERICSWEPGSLQASDSMLPMAQKCWITPFFVSVCLCLYRFLEFSCEMSWSGLALHLPAQRYVFFCSLFQQGFWRSCLFEESKSTFSFFARINSE